MCVKTYDQIKKDEFRRHIESDPFLRKLAGSLEGYLLEKYLQELMQQDLKLDMLHHTTHTDVISGMHLQKCLQDLT